jgi:hypothetical protein
MIGDRQRRDPRESFMDDSPLDARQHHGEALQVEETRRRIRPRGAQQNVPRLVPAQHVVDEIGRDRHLPRRLLLAGKLALDQPGDHGAVAEGALHQRGFLQPFLEIVAEHVLREQLATKAGLRLLAQADIAQAPDARP